MASVRMSADLRSTIICNAKQLFQPTLNKATNKLAPDFADRLMDEIYTEMISSLPIMQKAPIEYWPSDWLTNVKKVSCILIHPTINAEYNIHASDLIKTYKIPSTHNQVGWNGFDAKRFQCSDALFREYHEVREGIKKIQEEQKTFCNKIESIIKRCNTLKQFLELWPQGENLVPPDVMQTYNKPAEKRINPVIKDQIDIDDAALSSVLIKRTLVNRNQDK